MSAVANFLRNLKNDESGQDLIEYALVCGLIALATISSTTSLATAIANAFTGFGTQLSSAV